MQVFKVFEKSSNCVKKRRKSLKVFKFFSEELIILFIMVIKYRLIEAKFSQISTKRCILGCDLTGLITG
jgi:hypothetical protein